MRIIINADDFGMAASSDKAILQSFSYGVLSSTTIVANGATFESACQQVHEHHLLHRVGLHINLTDGIPLTEEIKKRNRFCDENGLFLPKQTTFNRLLAPLRSDERKALADEIRAQIHRCREQGLPLTHADSHNHVHTELMVGAVIMNVLKEEGIHYLRLTRNVGSSMSIIKKAYKYIFNGLLTMKGLRGVWHFSEINDFLSAYQRGEALKESVEIMCHPELSPTGSVIDMFGGDSIVDQYSQLKQLIPQLELITYGQYANVG